MSTGNCTFLSTKSSCNDNNTKDVLFVKVSGNIIDFVFWSKGYVNCNSAFDKDLEVPRPFQGGDNKTVLLFCLCHCIQA